METNTLLIIFLSVLLVIILLSLLLALLIGWFRQNRQRENRRSYAYALTPRTKKSSPAAIVTNPQASIADSLTKPAERVASTQSTIPGTVGDKSSRVDETTTFTSVAIPTDTVDIRPPIMTRIISYMDMNRKQRAALRKQAQFDYEQARGSSHQRILLDARKRIEQEKQKQEGQVKDLQRQLDTANSSHQAELRRALEQHIINTRFVEVDGIGNSLKTRIFDAIHPKSFADLRYAATVPGVGESRMAAIEVWLSQCNQQMPTLLAQSFPGSDAINQRFSSQKNLLQKNREQTQASLTILGQKIAEIDRHLSWLNTVSVQTYAEAAEGKADAQAQVARHTMGVFAEWEPIPTWFKKILDGKDIS